MFTRILVPTDFSEPSDAALDYARALARTFGASLRVLHVVESSLPAGPLGSEIYVADAAGLYTAHASESESKLAELVTPADRAGFNATTDVIPGSGAETIVSYAQAHGVDLIVMGTHGRTGLPHLFMGSVAEHVVRTAHCPVLTVRRAPARQAAMVSAATGTSRFGIGPSPA